MKRIVLRADGSAKTGLGHIMRSISLFELLRENFNCVFITNKADQQVKNLLNNFSSTIFIEAGTNEEELTALSRHLTNDDIFVADGYQFDENYQIEIRKLVHKLVVVDDEAKFFFYADVIINHGGLSDIPPYRATTGTKIYYGFPYLIARQEFIKAASEQRSVSNVDTVFICMGGADPYHITIKALQACAQCAFIRQIIIVTGSFFHDKQKLHELIKNMPDKKIHHYENAKAVDMVKYIRLSQLAFSTASSIAMEICCVKTALITGIIVDNQKSIHHQILDNKCGVSIGNWKDVSIDALVGMIQTMNNVPIVNEIIKNQGTCIDGKSGERIIQIFKELAA